MREDVRNPDLMEDRLREEPLFGAAQLLARAVETGLAADGSFLAINNKVSQSVPHLHVHVVPRWKSDGLFSAKLVWKRTPYKSDAERRAVQEKIRQALPP